MKFALVAMNVRFLYMICNFELSTVNSSMASKMAAEL